MAATTAEFSRDLTRAESPDQLNEIVVIIPARNEESSLPRVLNDLPPVGRVIVVNNGSTDRTAVVASRCGARIVNESRAGYGAACLAGLAEIERSVHSGTLQEPEIIAFLDGDYSDHPEQLPRLAQPILHDRADFVLGSRLLGERELGAMPLQSVLGNRLACYLMRLVWGHRYTDLGPFRLVRYDSLRQLQMNDRNFGWTIEMQIKAVAAGLRIQELPVPYRRRIGNSKISGTLTGTIKAGAKILYTIAKYARKSEKAKLVRLQQTQTA